MPVEWNAHTADAALNLKPEELPSAVAPVELGPEVAAGGIAPSLSKNVALSLFRVLINTVVALVLPSYLVHHLPVEKYSAWVLILQLAATVSFLDLGLQTGVAKFIAEHHARGDRKLAGRYASSGFALMLLTGALGVVLSAALSADVPNLFHDMPSSLRHDGRVSIFLVGASLAFNLSCSIFPGVFVGLQRYTVPILLSVLNKLLFAGVIVVALTFQSSLASMGAAVAAVNVFTGLLQIVLWQRKASHISVAWKLVERAQVREIVRYCFLMGIWSVGMLCVNGLDLTIVGRYAFHETAFYSVASQPTTFMITVLSATLAPLLPASSALSTYRTSKEMGNVLARTMRYSTTLLLLTGLPLLVYGYTALHVWVGPVYASHCVGYLRILVLGNMIRILCAPYATMVVGVGKVWEATGAPVVEAVINLGLSLYLARHLGAIGVAYGTLAGAVASVTMHFLVSMRFTQDKLAVSRVSLLLQSVLRPAIVALPSLALWLLDLHLQQQVSHRIPVIASWLVSTFLLAFFLPLNAGERRSLVDNVRRRFGAGTGAQAI